MIESSSLDGFEVVLGDPSLPMLLQDFLRVSGVE